MENNNLTTISGSIDLPPNVTVGYGSKFTSYCAVCSEIIVVETEDFHVFFLLVMHVQKISVILLKVKNLTLD